MSLMGRDLDLAESKRESETPSDPTITGHWCHDPGKSSRLRIVTQLHKSHPKRALSSSPRKQFQVTTGVGNLVHKKEQDNNT